MNITQEKEEKANKVVSTKVGCLKRLKDALSSMNNGGQAIFKGYTFDYDNKRLISPCKRYTLQWKLRHNPDQEESYENQQCTVGICTVEKIAI